MSESWNNDKLEYEIKILITIDFQCLSCRSLKLFVDNQIMCPVIGIQYQLRCKQLRLNQSWSGLNMCQLL